MNPRCAARRWRMWWTPARSCSCCRRTSSANTGRPRRADLCRAVSTAYYAMFHCLAYTCADSLAGRSRSVGNRPMWRRVYRAPEHRQARTRCENMPSSFPAGVREFGQAFSVKP